MYAQCINRLCVRALPPSAPPLRLLIDQMLALEETRDDLQQAVDRRNEELVIKNRSNQQTCHC